MRLRFALILGCFALVAMLYAVRPTPPATSAPAAVDQVAVPLKQDAGRVRLQRPSAVSETSQPSSAGGLSPQPEQSPSSAETPPPVDRDIMRLPDEERRALVSVVVHIYLDVGDACSEFADGLGSVAANVRLDNRGLKEVTVFRHQTEAGFEDDGYEDLPQALIDCFSDELWAYDWPQMEEGVEMPLALTMPLGR